MALKHLLNVDEYDDSNRLSPFQSLWVGARSPLEWDQTHAWTDLPNADDASQGLSVTNQQGGQYVNKAIDFQYHRDDTIVDPVQFDFNRYAFGGTDDVIGRSAERDGEQPLSDKSDETQICYGSVSQSYNSL
ncbi:hypothetical protein NX059_002182 [Plenodomus lindquistii]|nr:hypothetical protein NX059_002182 [Plenodomus lindquistii]